MKKESAPRDVSMVWRLDSQLSGASAKENIHSIPPFWYGGANLITVYILYQVQPN